MKKIVSLILVITIMLLVGCEEVTTEERDIKYFKDSTKIRVYIDEVTGVNYIVHNYYQKATAITPRLNADGTPYVSEVKGNE
jgi:hypothetical protein